MSRVQTPALLVVLVGGAASQVSHHIYSLTDLMATDTLQGAGHSVTLRPPPGFYPQQQQHVVTLGPPLGFYPQQQQQQQQQLGTPRPPPQPQQPVFLPTPLPALRHSPQPQPPSAAPVNGVRKGDFKYICKYFSCYKQNDTQTLLIFSRKREVQCPQSCESQKQSEKKGWFLQFQVSWEL